MCNDFHCRLNERIFEMINSHDILETINMIDNENLDVRTITMGISLLECIDDNIDIACKKVYDKICRYAENLVKTGEDISKEYGIPIIHKRIAVTPIAMLAAACPARNPVKFAKALEAIPLLFTKALLKVTMLLLKAYPKHLPQQKKSAHLSI